MNSEASTALASLDAALLARVEDASINASAPPQQLWMDGWLLRFNPGRAKRARCIYAVAPGQRSLSDKLKVAEQAYVEAGLPLVVRITRFSHPADLDQQLAARAYGVLDDTRVMVKQARSAQPQEAALPAGLSWTRLDAQAYAEAVGQLRGSPVEQREAHAQRLLLSPVAYRGYALQRQTDGAVMACGQYAREADLVGLYDVFTRPEARKQGLAALLCERLLSLAAAEGGRTAYLQVEADNHAARRIYSRLGFVDGYSYHYRQRPATASS